MRLQLDPAVGQAGDLQQTSATAGSAASARCSGAAGAQGSDRILISGAASLLASAAADRSVRIAQLTAAVQDGTYQPSSTAISQAIVSQALP